MSSRENKQQLPDLTNQILKTYEDLGTINHLGHTPLPQLDKIVEILMDFKEVLYPGYRRRQGLHQDNVSFYVGDLIDQIFNELSTQIARALQHEDVVFESKGEWSSYLEQGEQLTLRLLERLPEVRRVLGTDVQAAYDGDPACCLLYTSPSPRD